MLRFLIKRLLAILPVLLVVAVVVFLILRLTPGDPAAVIAGNSATNADIERIREQLGLNRSLLAQFGIWIGGVLHDLTGNYTAVMILSVAALVIAAASLGSEAGARERCEDRGRVGAPGGVLAVT